MITAEEMAMVYLKRTRLAAALREVEFKLANYRQASKKTVAYWLAVHTALERKGGLK